MENVDPDSIRVRTEKGRCEILEVSSAVKHSAVAAEAEEGPQAEARKAMEEKRDAVAEKKAELERMSRELAALDEQPLGEDDIWGMAEKRKEDSDSGGKGKEKLSRRPRNFLVCLYFSCRAANGPLLAKALLNGKFSSRCCM